MKALTDYYKKIFEKNKITNEPTPINSIYNLIVDVKSAVNRLVKTKQ